MLAAAVVYIVFKQIKKAYTLIDVATTLHLNSFAVGRIYSKIMNDYPDLIQKKSILYFMVYMKESNYNY
jgi:transcription initiation factor TFIIIB Brf1 subunit/transcription initiation factor TFIIB